MYYNNYNHQMNVKTNIGHSQYQKMDKVEQERPYSNDFFLTAEEGFVKGNYTRSTYRPYRHHVPLTPVAKTKKESLLLEIAKHGGFIVDLTLHLDINPDDLNARQLLVEQKRLYRRFEEEYEKEFGPLHMASEDSKEKSWSSGPWPWEE